MKFKATLLAASLLLFSNVAVAGPSSDALTACLVGKSTMDDHVVLVQWLFAAMSKHPAIASMAMVSDDKVDAANARMAEVFMRLMTVTCKNEAKAAYKNEGSFAFSQAFQALGQEAGKEIFMDPNVMKDMATMSKYVDNKKLADLMGP
ncbi:hypothetical protein [Dyella nitratireducens]|uniref:Uncharacterized protein n=1 Tax=Dyella nitratireducens TaxID=1849580 RepID=A0ABQ1GAF9_9GAMM|nr:hypothetical protein [Dyella nitratireducens]GGA39801.1 hypothetical protein GCM10010981_31300 [Dyella nitratireducens]GLQ40487.1 hypothetical protein GCM10007902_03360 [Dyella nitratireducens]